MIKVVDMKLSLVRDGYDMVIAITGEHVQEICKQCEDILYDEEGEGDKVLYVKVDMNRTELQGHRYGEYNMNLGRGDLSHQKYGGQWIDMKDLKGHGQGY